MSKKKAIKITTATAIAASAFVAVAPTQSEAATSSVDKAITKATNQMAKAYDTYHKTAKNENKLPKTATIRNEVKLAKDYYAAAEKEIAKNGGSKTKKATYTKTLNAKKYFLDRAEAYLAAINTNLNPAKTAFTAAVETGKAKNVGPAKAALVKDVEAFEATVAKIYGPDVRDLLLEKYEAPATKLANSVNDELKVYEAYKKIEAGKLADLEETAKLIESVKTEADALKGKTTKLAKTLAAVVVKNDDAYKVAYEAAQVPVVKEVSAINATQVKVTFNKAVDATDADLVAKYTIAGVQPSDVEVAEDGKSATLTFASASQVEGTDLAVVVQPIKTAADELVLTKRYAGLLSFEDTVKADVATISSKTNGSTASSVVIDFTEPVQAGAVIKIDGVVAGTTSAGTKTTLTSQSLDATKSHVLEVVNLTDGGNNVTSLVTKSFSVVKDTVAPTVSKVEASGDNHILVTFDKAVTLSSVQSKVSVKDEILGSVGIGAITTVTPGATTSDTQFLIPVTNGLYGTANTRNLNVVFDKEIKDVLGNDSTATTKTVTLSKDTVAPVVTSIVPKYQADGKTAGITLNFSEGIAALPTGFDETQIRVIAPDGSDVTSGFFNANQSANAVTAGAKKAVVELATATKLSGTYKFIIASEAVTDQAQTPVKSTAFSGTINFGAAEAGKFEINPASAISSSADKDNKITVNFGTAVKGGSVAGSATEASNYTLGGKALPAGTVLTLDSATKSILTIDLPNTESVSANDQAIFTVSGVQNLSGDTVTPVTKAVTVVDNTAAILQSARALDNQTIELTYNENVAALLNADVGTEFNITQGNTAFTVADADLKASSVSGFGTKLRLVVDKTVTAANPGSPAVLPSTGTVAPSKAGSTGTVSGTYSGTADKNYSVAVKTVDGSGEAAVVTVDGNDIAESVAGNHTFVLGNGLTIVISKGTATLATGDTFTFSATAAKAAVPSTPAVKATLDLTKDITIESVVPVSGVDVKDTATNNQKAAVKVTVSK